LNQAIVTQSLGTAFYIFLHNQSNAYHLAQEYKADQEENVEDVVKKTFSLTSTLSSSQVNPLV
jgi:hypothetical protein